MVQRRSLCVPVRCTLTPLRRSRRLWWLLAPDRSRLCFGLPLGSRLATLLGRRWRVIFATFSLPRADSWIVYYIGHVHDGSEFWNFQANPAAHGLAWTINFASFFFLYPTVFNLKEVAAVETPRIHLWETGIIRITRHPQAVGQVMWSAAHLAMVGSTF